MYMKQLKSELTRGIPESLANFDQLPDSAHIRLPVMKGLYSLSSASIWRGVKSLKIPSPVKLPVAGAAHGNFVTVLVVAAATIDLNGRP